MLRQLLDYVDGDRSLSVVLEYAALGWIAEMRHDLAAVGAEKRQPSVSLEDAMREFESGEQS